MGIFQKKHVFLIAFLLLTMAFIGHGRGNEAQEGPCLGTPRPAYNPKARQYAPLTLVGPKRADLMAKYIYAKHREWGASNSFAKDLYYNHLRVWNNFVEYDPPNPQKNSFSEFVDDFHKVLDSIKTDGYLPERSLVRVDKEGNLRTGAHRLVTCLLYDRTIYGENSFTPCPDWGFDFFKRKNLDEKFIDAMAIQYCELKPNSYILIIYPSVIGKTEDVEKIINKYAKIVYLKSAEINQNGGLNVILQAYDKEPFVYEEGKISRRAKDKAALCFPADLIPTNPTRIYLLESDSLANIQGCKREIRDLFKISNHSVHTTDTHEQAILLAKAFFNKNSLHCLNNRKEQSLKNADAYFEKYRDWLKGKNPEWFAVDTSGVLAIYGLRDCRDWDFLFFKDCDANSDLAGISGHNDSLKYHTLDKDTILFDPEYHFYYKGVKFCSLPVVRAMKASRNEPKDVKDVGLIDTLF